MLPAIKQLSFMTIANFILRTNAKTVIDVGGVGRLKAFLTSDHVITDANIKDGIDGCNLPWLDSHFDISISIDTLEHVNDKPRFISESMRVSKLGSAHYFLYGDAADQVEKIKQAHGHSHPYTPIREADLSGVDYELIPVLRAQEHLALMPLINPKLAVSSFYKASQSLGNTWYGYLMIVRK